MTQNSINTSNIYIQLVTASTIATTSAATTLPFDNTIPQITEGDEVLTVTITPTSTTSKLLIRFTCQASFAVQNIVAFALFQDATAGALAAVGTRRGNLTTAKIIPLTYVMTSGTTSSTTFRIRMGNIATGTDQLNVDTLATRLMGGVSSAWLTVEEYL